MLRDTLSTAAADNDKRPHSHLVDWVEDVLREATHEPGPGRLRPLLVLGVVELVAPQALHQFRLLDLELVRVDLGKLLERERPAVQARAEADGPARRVHHDLAHRPVVIRVCADDDVDILDGPKERLVEVLRLQLEGE